MLAIEPNLHCSTQPHPHVFFHIAYAAVPVMEYYGTLLCIMVNLLTGHPDANASRISYG